jgi:hypothetical protein
VGAGAGSASGCPVAGAGSGGHRFRRPWRAPVRAGIARCAVVAPLAGRSSRWVPGTRPCPARRRSGLGRARAGGRAPALRPWSAVRHVIGAQHRSQWPGSGPPTAWSAVQHVIGAQRRSQWPGSGPPTARPPMLGTACAFERPLRVARGVGVASPGVRHSTRARQAEHPSHRPRRGRTHPHPTRAAPRRPHPRRAQAPPPQRGTYATRPQEGSGESSIGSWARSGCT